LACTLFVVVTPWGCHSYAETCRNSYMSCVLDHEVHYLDSILRISSCTVRHITGRLYTPSSLISDLFLWCEVACTWIWQLISIYFSNNIGCRFTSHCPYSLITQCLKPLTSSFPAAIWCGSVLHGARGSWIFFVYRPPDCAITLSF